MVGAERRLIVPVSLPRPPGAAANPRYGIQARENTLLAHNIVGMKQGDVVHGRYLLEERLGKGGMGQVWRALDQRLQRTVAIKIMAPQFTEEPEFLVRFLREAQSIARISHPNVVSVLDFGEEGDSPLLVMEYVPGKSLGELTGEPMEPRRAVAVVAQAADAAGAAHAQGIVHRDIKPSNIVLSEDGRAKLVDFGIASLKDVDRITQTGTTIGSPHYISPEQASGEKATPASDVYALGVVLFELLTGKKPFDAESVAGVAMAHIEQEPRPPSELVPGLDPKLDQIVLKAMSKQPSQRYADGRELAEALGPGSAARTTVVPAQAAAGSQTLVMAPSKDVISYESPSDDDEGSPWKAALIGLLIGLGVLALMLVAYQAFANEDEPAESSTPTEEVTSPSDGNTAPVIDQPTEDPTEEPPPSEAPPDSPPASPPASDSGDEDDGEEDEEETVESDVDVDSNPGNGPDGEGAPGLEGKDKDKD